MKRAPLRATIKRVEEEWCETAAEDQRERLYSALSAMTDDERRSFTEHLFGAPTTIKNPDGTYTHTWEPDH